MGDSGTGTSTSGTGTGKGGMAVVNKPDTKGTGDCGGETKQAHGGTRTGERSGK